MVKRTFYEFLLKNDCSMIIFEIYLERIHTHFQY